MTDIRRKINHEARRVFEKRHDLNGQLIYGYQRFTHPFTLSHLCHHMFRRKTIYFAITFGPSNINTYTIAYYLPLITWLVNPCVVCMGRTAA